MPIDLESFREGYRLRARLVKLQDLCSPSSVDRLFRNLERNVVVLARDNSDLASVSPDSSVRQTMEIVSLFGDFDKYLAENQYLLADEVFLKDLDLLRKSRDSFHRELRRLYSSRNGLFSSLDQNNLLRDFVYPRET